MNRTTPVVLMSAFAAAVLISSCSESQIPEMNSVYTEFVSIRQDEIDWAPIPDDEEILSAILVGDPNAHGPLVARYQIPPGMEIVAHRHHEVRSYTIISGVWELGFGEVFDPQKLVAYPQGSYYRLPAGVAHFQKAGPDGAVIQIESIGPDTFVPVE